MARLIRLLLIAGVCLMATLVLAQDTPTEITADDVNAVAEKLYCPVCENIPLDTCGTAACADWRNEIRVQLESGMTSDEVIADFVRRFGDRVVGTPQDPALAALSLVTPWVLAGVALAIGLYFLLRHRRRAEVVPLPDASNSPAPGEDAYYEMLRKDVES